MRGTVGLDAHHDHGAKTILGHTGDLGGEDVVEILARSDACHRFLAGKLIRFFSHPDPTAEQVATIAAVLGREAQVERVQNAAGSGDAEVTLEVRMVVPAERRDTLALPQPGGAQGGRELPAEAEGQERERSEQEGARVRLRRDPRLQIGRAHV